jgi:hypothetical protein
MTAFQVPPQIAVLRQRAQIAAGIGVVALGIGALIDTTQFFRSYLYAFLFWLGVGIGCQSILMIHHLTGGLWGLGIRRMLEAGSRVLRLSWLGFLPLVFGLKRLYIWADPSRADGELHELIEHKHLFLNVPFFLGRAAIYFAVWALLATLLNKWSLEQDATTGDVKLARRLRGVSGVGLVLMGLTITFAAIDWAMSLDPAWFSTMYGITFMVGQALSAFTLILILVSWLRDQEPLRAVITASAAHDLGKLYFAFIMLWGYVNVSQFIIVWSGNLPEEIPWYLRRNSGGWHALTLVLVLLHFVLPFLLLLSRGLKRNAGMLGLVASWMLVARLLDLFWVVGPELHVGNAFRPHWLDLAAVAGIGGVWLASFAWQLATRPLLAQGDPELRDVLAAGGHAA